MTNGRTDQSLYPSQRLAAKIAAKTLHADPAQAAVAARLDQLIDRLQAAALSRRKLPMVIRQIMGQIIGQLFGRMLPPDQSPAKGLYIYGGVGRGKTMLMDMFHDSVVAQGLNRPDLPAVWRLHFHDFMVLAQDVIHQARSTGADDPIEMAAADLARRGAVICFDEMEVRDIADAMILARLFSGMLKRGVIVVATSNRHADDLYKNGLHRDRFLPFIDLLKQRCEMCQLDDGTDWRGAVLADLPAWHVPSQTARPQLESAFDKLAGGVEITAETIRVAGRDITIERAAGDVGFASFASLCDVPLGARDYLAIAGRFAGLVLSDVPQFTDANENVARRFMWLIDALYDRGRFLIASAEADIGHLYQGHQWQFEFVRTASRLGEMAKRGRIQDSV
ncbi:MAG: cell division protein ZapE [Alphaproteobacteria bacterium]|nr:cell division protein ZapE [Alphaproteobacteria bacterium]